MTFRVRQYLGQILMGIMLAALLGLLALGFTGCATAPVVKTETVPVEDKEPGVDVYFMGTRATWDDLYVCQLARKDVARQMPGDGLYCVEYLFFHQRLREWQDGKPTE